MGTHRRTARGRVAGRLHRDAGSRPRPALDLPFGREPEARRIDRGTRKPTERDRPEKKGREARLATSQELPPGLQKPKEGTLSTIIGAFKSAATRRINEHRDTRGETVWQSRFHDRIVRNREELDRIRWYIRRNPERLHRD